MPQLISGESDIPRAAAASDASLPLANSDAVRRQARQDDLTDARRRLHDPPPSAPETDVNQELVVLDADQSDAFADRLIDREVSRDRTPVASAHVCVSTLGFALLIATITLLLLLAAVAVFVAQRYRPMQKSRLWDAIAAADRYAPDAPSTASSMTRIDDPAAVLRRQWPVVQR